uniref:Uncharacterized protein n=1 Tax=Microcebus murinus TaxID=30608 RepID=A0A8C5XTH5_MICMU
MAAQIPESDQIKQFKEFLGTYNKLTETHFLDLKPEETTSKTGLVGQQDGSRL